MVYRQLDLKESLGVKPKLNLSHVRKNYPKMYEIFPSPQLLYNIYRLSLIINLVKRILCQNSG